MVAVMTPPAVQQKTHKVADPTQGADDLRKEMESVVAAVLKAQGHHPSAIVSALLESGLIPPTPRPGERGVQVMARLLDPEAFMGPSPKKTIEARKAALTRAASLAYVMRASGWVPEEDRGGRPTTAPDGRTLYRVCTLSDIAHVVPVSDRPACVKAISTALSTMNAAEAMMGPVLPLYAEWSPGDAAATLTVATQHFGINRMHVGRPAHPPVSTPESDGASEDDDPAEPSAPAM